MFRCSCCMCLRKTQIPSKRDREHSGSGHAAAEWPQPHTSGTQLLLPASLASSRRRSSSERRGLVVPSRKKGAQRTSDSKHRETSGNNAHMANASSSSNPTIPSSLLPSSLCPQTMGGGAEGMCCKGREKAVRFTSVLGAKLPARSSWEWAQHFKKAFDLRAWDNLRVGMTESRSATTTASGVDSRSGQSARVVEKKTVVGRTNNTP